MFEIKFKWLCNEFSTYRRQVFEIHYDTASNNETVDLWYEKSNNLYFCQGEIFFVCFLWINFLMDSWHLLTIWGSFTHKFYKIDLHPKIFYFSHNHLIGSRTEVEKKYRFDMRFDRLSRLEGNSTVKAVFKAENYAWMAMCSVPMRITRWVII